MIATEEETGGGDSPAANGRRVKKPTLRQRLFAREYVRNGGNGIRAARAAYNPSTERAANAIASANLRKDAVLAEIRRVMALAGPAIADALAALRKLHGHKNPRARLLGFDCMLDLARFADEPSGNDEAWDFRAELRGCLVCEHPTLEDWFRTLDGLLGGEHPIRVRLAAAERLLRLGEALKKRGPGPGRKRSDTLFRMRLANLPMPVLQHMIDAGTEEIPSEEEQRRILEEHWAAERLEWNPCPEGVNQ